jgi:hypothetical protein
MDIKLIASRSLMIVDSVFVSTMIGHDGMDCRDYKYGS